MRWISGGVAAVMLSACGHAHTKMGASDVIAMKEEGFSDSRIIKEVEKEDVVLTLTDDDIVSLVVAGLSQEVIDALLARARDVGTIGHGH